MQAKIDIFEGLRKCSAEEQSTLAALLEQGHLERAVFPEVKERLNKVIGFFNKGAEIPTIPFETVLEQAKQRFLTQSHDERLAFIRASIADRVSFTSSKSGPAVTLAALRGVAKKHGADSYMMPRALARHIVTSKLKQMSDEFQKRWNEATPQQKAQFDSELANQLAAMSPEQQRELRDALKLEKLNVETVRGVMFSLGSTIGLSGIVNIAGFGAYISLSVIVHFIFTTILGITLPFAFYAFLSSTLAFFANPIVAIPLGLSTMSFQWVMQGKKMNTELIDTVVFTGLAQQIGDMSELPASQRWCASVSDREEFVRQTQRAIELKKARTQHENDTEKVRGELKRAEEEIAGLRNSLASARADTEAARAKWSSFERQLAEFDAEAIRQADTDPSQTDSERTHLEELVNAARDALRTSQEALEQAEATVDLIPGIKARIAAMQDSLLNLEAALSSVEKRLGEIYENRAKHLSSHIEVRAPSLTCNEQVFAALARLENLEEIQQAEDILIELNEGVYQQVGGPGGCCGYDYAWFGTGHRLYFLTQRGLHIEFMGHHVTSAQDYDHLRIIATVGQS